MQRSIRQRDGTTSCTPLVTTRMHTIVLDAAANATSPPVDPYFTGAAVG
jgi:hypothetical protein